MRRITAASELRSAAELERVIRELRAQR